MRDRCSFSTFKMNEDAAMLPFDGRCIGVKIGFHELYKDEDSYYSGHSPDNIMISSVVLNEDATIKGTSYHRGDKFPQQEGCFFEFGGPNGMFEDMKWNGNPMYAH